MCDVYVCESCYGGWTTHVAGARAVIPPVPDIMWRMPLFGGRWDNGSRKVDYPSRRHEIAARIFFRFAGFWHTWLHMGSLKLIPRRSIGLPHDGETFEDDTAGDCADTLEWLRSMGYNVPQYAIDALRDESAEGADA